MKYVALLRGINSGQNPSQRMDNLRKIFEKLGFKNVKTVIASGNVLFESKAEDRNSLETKIEIALKKETGAETATIIYTKDEIQQLVGLNPFKNLKENKRTKPNVTFLKEPTNKNIPDGKGYRFFGTFGRAICYIIDISDAKTPDVMRMLEKEFGRSITTRTWNTVNKINTS